MKKPLSILSLMLFCLISLTSLGYSQTDYYVKSSNGLNLREGKGSNYKVQTSIPAGAKVEVIDKSDEEWWKVSYQGSIGYVSSEHLTDDEKEAEEAARKSRNTNKNSSTVNRDSNRNSSLKSSTSSNSKSAASNDANWGIGIRLGDPSGISVKRFLGDKALELNIGQTAFWGYDYRDEFNRFDNFSDYDFQGHNLRSAISIQLHYNTYADLNLEGVEGLKWYWGIGAQARTLSIEYSYRYRNAFDNWVYEVESINDLDVGVDGVLGLDYTFKNAPVSIFVDVNLFAEILDRFFVLRWQSGLGARYNF